MKYETALPDVNQVHEPKIKVVVGASSPNWQNGRTVQAIVDKETGTFKGESPNAFEATLSAPGEPHYGGECMDGGDNNASNVGGSS